MLQNLNWPLILNRALPIFIFLLLFPFLESTLFYYFRDDFPFLDAFKNGFKALTLYRIIYSVVFSLAYGIYKSKKSK